MLRVLLVALITTLRPLLGPRGACRYKLTCTKYARLMLQDFPLYKAIPLIIKRVISCNPLSAILTRSSKKRFSKEQFKH